MVISDISDPGWRKKQVREINIGAQGFEEIRIHNDFYIDKTSFIREWWEERDTVTLITRPRRFGKTLNLDMLNCFFSNQYKGRSDLFEGLSIWQEEKYRNLQGTIPVIFLSFADVKQRTFADARKSICLILLQVINRFHSLWEAETETVKKHYSFCSFSMASSDAEAAKCLQSLSLYLEKYFGQKVLIFLDEYDTPLQEAFVNGYWDEMAGFIRELFNSTFKTNPALGRALMTGITRVSKESIFSDLNNLQVVTTTAKFYETAFGFTEEEVFDALDEYGMGSRKEAVREWYDGFTFGNHTDIYNPWSIVNFLKRKEFRPYWANTSSNSLISRELQKSSPQIKHQMEELLNGGTVESVVDEEVIYSQLEQNEEAIWSLFLASGYLKILSDSFDGSYYHYSMALTNKEVRIMFRSLIRNWFGRVAGTYADFTGALIRGDEEAVNYYLEDILLNVAGSFDTQLKASPGRESESFYHGLVLGLVATEQSYRVTSSRESGLGRYDVLMCPKKKSEYAIIIEFKLFDKKKEKTLEETAERALRQIREKKYDAELIKEGIRPEQIIHYGMGFRKKEVLVKKEKPA